LLLRCFATTTHQLRHHGQFRVFLTRSPPARLCLLRYESHHPKPTHTFPSPNLPHPLRPSPLCPFAVNLMHPHHVLPACRPPPMQQQHPATPDHSPRTSRETPSSTRNNSSRLTVIATCPPA
jgi:hypothetical protein